MTLRANLQPTLHSLSETPSMITSQPSIFLVDVFTQDAFWGNPVAVIVPGTRLPPELMLRIARWTGMPETVFVLPQEPRGPEANEADYSVRIWSPLCELPFAGHPSIGTAHVLLEEGAIEPTHGRFVQQCPAGRIDMRVTSIGAQRRISFRTPVPTVERLDEAGQAAVLAALGCTGASTQVALVDAGARWLVVELISASDVNALKPNLEQVQALSALYRVSGVTVLGHEQTGDANFEVRSFAPAIGVPEDAVCGGGNACAAAWVAYRNDWRMGCADGIISQGRHVGRAGRVFWEGPDQDRRIGIGGFAVTISAGTFRLH